MKLGNRIKLRLGDISKDTSGGMAVTWALSMMAVVFAVGATYDMSQLTKAKQSAQMIADSMALTASIAVDTNNERRYKENKHYPYKELGSPGVDFTNSMTGKVNYNVDDDGDGEGNLIARSTITGTYQPAFMSAFGYADIPFEATSDVTYAQNATTPASVLLILDNSGSMAWDDNMGFSKIDGLRTTVSNFMVTLDELTVDASPEVLRTGLLAYSSKNYRAQACGWRRYGWQWRYTCWYTGPQLTDNKGIFKNNKVSMRWGRIPMTNVTRLTANGGTDPSGALQVGKNWMNKENAKHTDENGETTPLKYVVLMTDGANNSTSITNSSLTKCTQIKNQGTVIYTIGYDLNVGNQYQNGSYVTYFSQSAVNAARSFLLSCATDANHYILADNASDLEEVFGQIGQEISAEVIRVKH